MNAPALLIIPLAAAVISAALVGFAWRGRRVDDHPICRRCGFDLFGRPEDSSRCGECGADLQHERAVRTGRREKRRRLLGAALPVLLLCAGWFGVLGWGRARGVDWNRHKPVWWLLENAEGADVPARDAALAELARRAGDGTMSPDRQRAVLERALAHQGNAKQPWVPGWGQIVEAARNRGGLPDEQWRRYLMQALDVTLEPVHPTFRRSDVLELEIRRRFDRVASARVWMGDPDRFEVDLVSDGRLRIGPVVGAAEVKPGAFCSVENLRSSSPVR